MSGKMIIKNVLDLGVAAYLLMHGFKVAGKQGKAFYFEVEPGDEQEFDSLVMDYLSLENPYHRFDTCLMSLKKMGEYRPS